MARRRFCLSSFGRLRWLVRSAAVVTAASLVLAGVDATLVRPPATAAPAAAAAPAPGSIAARPDVASAAASARGQGSRVKVDGAGSPASETFANPDGSVTTEAYGRRAFRRGGVHRDGSSWVPLAAQLSGSGTAADPFIADGAARRVTFGQSAAAMLSVDVPGGPVTVSASGLALTTPTRSGAAVTFPGVAADTDLQLEAGAVGVKANLVLKSAGAPTSFRFHVADPRGALGTVAQQADGSWQFSADLGDGYHLAFAPATAYAPAEVAARQEVAAGVDRSSASESVVRAGDGFDVTLAVNPAWLAGKTFPVVLDPSPVFVDGSAGFPDCDLHGGPEANISFCSAATRDTGFGAGYVRRTILDYDLTSIPKTAVVSAADMDLNLNAQSGGTMPVNVYRMTKGWSLAATWNSNGAVAWTTPGGDADLSTVLASTTVGPSLGHYHWAMTSTVQGWVANPASTFGVMLRPVDESIARITRFDSGFAANPAVRPRLTVTYNTPPLMPGGRYTSPVGNGGQFTASLQPRLTGVAGDADGDLLRHDFELYAGWGTPGTPIATGQVPGIAQNARASWTVPAGLLVNGGQYQWRERAFDGALFSP